MAFTLRDVLVSPKEKTAVVTAVFLPADPASLIRDAASKCL